MSNIPKDTKQVEEAIWEIPTSFKQGMNVPARVIATKKLLESMDAGVFEQLTNVACLPGIQKAAICMPDGHWGYGFPIGGVAAMDAEEGVISPGGIGFDINCITGDSKIMTEYGYYIKIQDYMNNPNLKTKSIDFKNNKEIATRPILFLKKEAENNIFKIKTKSGSEIIASSDHPFYTNRGMVKIEEINKNDKLAVNPFDGIQYTNEDKTILDEENIKKIAPNRNKIIKELKDKDLLPLKISCEKLPIIAKLVGFLQGDGHLNYYYNKNRAQNVWSMVVIGNEEDLIKVKSDIKCLGFGSATIKTKQYKSKIKNLDNTIREIKGSSTQMHISSQSLSILLHALGVPKGDKSYTKILIPGWVKESPLWIKRLYLAGLFGAEMSSPLQGKNESYSFKEPSFSQNKVISLKASLLEFILGIKDLLNEFDINTTKIYNAKGVINKQGDETTKIILKISTKSQNLVNLWGKIGFEYSGKKKRTSLLALQYVKTKINSINKIQLVAENALVLKNNGISEAKILEYAKENNVSPSQIKGKLYNDSKNTRITKNFPKFNEFVLKNALKEGGDFVWDEIASIEKLNESIDVYDFTINHEDHNFIANNFVISNCGMRLVTTNLTIKDVQPKIKELVNTLFSSVPSGVGCKGFVKVNNNQFNEVMEQGAKWCIDNGYGWKEDLDRIESSGKIEWADSSKISQKARQRGIDQLGTLGSGNHYLEIQHVKEENIMDEKLAKKFGIFKDQIVIMFHCGSRGFGHQVATDYLKIFEEAMKKYNLKVNDPELSCAPFSSPEGQDYYKAMACAANMAFSNRQVILHRIRESFEKVFKMKPEAMDMHCVYDVAHNLARLQEFKIDGRKKKLIVHRKGATLCQGPGNEEISKTYRDTGSPVIIGGSMETGSYLLVGTEKADQETFSSTAHGSGRTMSRHQAKKEFRGDQLQKDMESRGIYVKTGSMSGLAEEAGSAYKEINDVIDALAKAGITKPVTKLLPIGNIKG